MFESILLIALMNAPPAAPVDEAPAADEPKLELELELLYEMPAPDGRSEVQRSTPTPIAAPNSFDVRWGWVFMPEDQALPGTHPMRANWRRHLMF